MVFESVVTDLLNRVLGDYVQNFDPNQLSISIWGGDVVLNDLFLKTSALDDLGLPFKVIVGKLGKLTMKVPWKSLYTSPVEITIQDLLLLVVPSSSVAYNQEAEEKAALASKMKELERIEEIRKKEQERKRQGTTPTPVQDDTFAQKLVTQIIKNLQIRIESIHIRYEDSTTKPNAPFGFGVILKHLNIETTDEHWKPQIISETVQTIHKIANLKGLSLYWNSNTKILSRNQENIPAILEQMTDMVVNDHVLLTHVLGPISSEAKVRLTPSPEKGPNPFSMPKAIVELVMEELALGLTNRQFQDVTQLADSMDSMTRAQYYRKYRPVNITSYKGHYRAWWKFAFKCVMEEDVRRRRNNWDPEYLHQHHLLKKKYHEAYYEKLTTPPKKKVKPEIEAQIKSCEERLDIFNITLIRKNVELLVDRLPPPPEEKSTGWFGGWLSWGGGTSDETTKTSGVGMDDIVQQFGQALTPEEKAKLFNAIDYEEQSGPIDFPKEYVEYNLNFKLLKLRCTVNDEDNKSNLLELIIADVQTLVSTRPVKNCLKLEVNMSTLGMTGTSASSGAVPPVLLTTVKTAGASHLFHVLFETNPLDSHVDQRVAVSAQPLEVVYHSKTIIELVKCFTLPPDIQLAKLQAQTQASLNEWKEQSTTGLQYLIEQRGVIEINVDIIAPYILVPQGGELGPNKSVLIVDLGEIHVNSKPREAIEQPKLTGQSAEEYKQSVLEKSYDSFLIKLKHLQVLLTLPDEDYKQALQSNVYSKAQTQAIHLIKSDEFEIQLDQCLVQDDVRLPKLKLSASLPLLDLDISEHRLLELFQLLVTLPLPESEPINDVTFGDTANSLANDPALAEAYAVTRITHSDTAKKKDEDAVQFTNMVVHFNVDSIRLRVNRALGLSRTLASPLIQFELSHIRFKLTQRTFGETYEIDVGGLTLEAINSKDPDLVGPLYLLKTPMTEGADTYLLKVHMFTVTPNCPEKFTTNVKQQIKVDISSLDIVLHLEALKSILSFVDETLESFEKAKETVQKPESDSTSMASQSSRKIQKQVSKLEATRKAVAKKYVNKNDVLLQIDAHLNSLTVQLTTETKNIVKMVLAELDVGVIQRPHKSLISMDLRELSVISLDATSFYKNIVTMEADKVVHVHVTIYNDATKGKNYMEMNKHDIKVKVKTGCAKVVFLSSFVNEVLGFVDKFQAAKDAVAEASAAAGAVAIENVEQAYSSTSRIALDIELEAPKILIPRNPQNSSAILADFGHLKIQNMFTKLQGTDATNAVIVDEMKVVLSQMKLSRVTVEEMKQTIIVEILMLDPLSATVTVQRNLSAEWYHEIPNIEVVGKLEDVFLRASKEDYDLMMACLTENVAAPGPAPEPQVPEKRRRRSSTSRRNSIKGSRKSAESVVPKEGGVTSASSQIEKPKDHCTVKLDILIVKTGFVMYEGSSKLEGNKGLVQRDKNSAFADFCIDNITLSLAMFSNNNMNCDIIVQDMNLEDCRPGAREIKHLIQRKARSTTAQAAEDSAIAKVTYRVDAAGKKGTTINVESTSLTLVLCLDYLLQIVGFFASADSKPKTEIPKPETLPIPAIADTQGAGDAGRGGGRTIDTILEEGTEAVEEVNIAEEPLPTNMYITLGETEIILVETMETVDTHAMLLTCEVSMKMSSLGTKSNIMGAVNRLTLSTGNYNPVNRASTLAEVISPMSVTFVMNTSDENGTLIDINISDIFIRLTAGTLELLIKVSTSISASPVDGAGVKEGKNYTDIWNVRQNDGSDYWFLKQDATVEIGEEALNLPEDKVVKLFEVAEDLVKRERLVLESGCIVLTFETGYGSNTTPILLLETDIDMQLFDWSDRLQFAGRLKLEAAYYNAVYGMWEFLIEPVESRHHGKVSHQAWELLFEFSTVDCITSATGDGDGPVTTKPPTFMAISLLSSDILELTITKTALEVINIITKDFGEAVKALVSQRDVSTSPYTIVNDCGSEIELDLLDSGFALVRKGLVYDKAQLKHGTSLNLALTQSYDMTKHHTSILKEQEGKEERLLKLLIPDYDFCEAIPVNRAEKRYYELKKKTEWGSNYAIICDVSVKDCSKVVTIRSVVQILNELTFPVDIYSMDNTGNALVLLGTAEKDKPYNIPLTGIYTKSCELFFAPQGYSVSTLPYIWTCLMEKLQGISFITSRPRNPPEGQGADFHIKVVGHVKQALWKGTNRKTLGSQYCNISLKPPLILDNLLPTELGYFISGTSQLITTEKGHCVQVTDIEVQKKEFEIKLKIPNYGGESWTSTVKVNKTTQELSTRPFLSDKTGQVMSLGIHKEIADEIVILHIYCPSWMINRTGLDLSYKGEDKDSPVIRQSAQTEEPVLFSFREKSFFAKKKAMVSIDGKSEWSEKFSLDVAGSCGSVTCASTSTDYQVGIEIVLTSWGLTKTVIFTPRFYITNQCITSILVFEKELDSKQIKLEPSTTVAFWPQSKVQQAVVCFEDDAAVRSKPIAYDQIHNTLLELPNKYGGIHADIHMTEVSTVLTFSNFIPGQAPALLVNATTDCIIEISEKGVEATRLLHPNTSQLITWADPLGKRVLTWTPQSGGKKNVYTDKLHGDGTGTYKFTDSSNVEKEYYWVCFLDDLQRVLLFTPDPMLCAYLQSARDIEVPTGDYTIMLHGLGISLVDNEKCKELMYMRMASSDIAWQITKPGKKPRYKPLPSKDSTAIETAYQNYLTCKAAAASSSEPVKSVLSLDIGMQVDFVDLKILKPKQYDLRRVFQTGLWLHYKQFPHSKQIHAKVNRIQIDNQLNDCIFRIVLAPIPPPKSVSTANDLPKPFAEVSIMQRMTAHSSVIQYKYFKVLIQEFHIRLDINFVNALVELFSNQSDRKVEHMVDFFTKDYDEACTTLEAFLARHNTSQGQKHFYDFLHFSPLKIHVSFSMGGATQLSNNFLNLLLQSVGVTLTEIQDVVFKLACLELQHMFLSGDQLYAEAYSHYSSQAIKQLYVLVLGLDVIGNPYGLVMGVTEGVEAFFYEPFQGAIQGPGEFAEGLALGVKSLVGSTLGGAAGALGKITGTLGKGLAALTMDEDYQRKRRENLSKRNNDVAEGMAQSGKGLVMGFVDGVSGVFTKPFKGAKSEGVGGFFKGLGKGAVGLVARPTAGVVDFTSGTFDAVKKATTSGEEVRRMRPPRYIPVDSVIQPYVCHEAEGMQLLHELEKGKYISTDTYVAHALVNPHGVYVLLLTNKRILYLKKEEFFGGWAIVWTHIWDELDGPPVVVEKGLKFLTKHKKKRRFGSLRRHHKPKELYVPLYSADVCTWMLNKIETAMKTETIDGSVTAASNNSTMTRQQNNSSSSPPPTSKSLDLNRPS